MKPRTSDGGRKYGRDGPKTRDAHYGMTSLEKDRERSSEQRRKMAVDNSEMSPGQPRTAHELLRWGWDRLVASPELVAPFALGAVALTVAQAGITVEPTADGAVPQFAPWVWAVYLGTLVGDCIGLGAVFLTAADIHAGVDRSYARRLAAAAERLPTMLATAIVGSIPILGGLLAVVVPGLYFLIKFAFALPASVVGGGGVAASLRRSFVTTSGRASVIAGLVAAFVAVTVVLSIVVTMAFARPGHRGFVGPLLHNLVTAVLIPWFGLAFGLSYADQ